mmetsp:Transcript_3792/g.8113  ORF Transcript_3792/g.8113 Transcript_3792/m.8113 type:complete len:242 (+) Transcript_3792:909-1634(+)
MAASPPSPPSLSACSCPPWSFSLALHSSSSSSSSSVLHSSSSASPSSSSTAARRRDAPKGRLMRRGAFSLGWSLRRGWLEKLRATTPTSAATLATLGGSPNANQWSEAMLRAEAMRTRLSGSSPPAAQPMVGEIATSLRLAGLGQRRASSAEDDPKDDAIKSSPPFPRAQTRTTAPAASTPIAREPLSAAAHAYSSWNSDPSGEKAPVPTSIGADPMQTPGMGRNIATRYKNSISALITPC